MFTLERHSQDSPGISQDRRGISVRTLPLAGRDNRGHLRARARVQLRRPSVEFRPSAPTDTVSADAAGVASATQLPDAHLGFVNSDGEAIALENGGRVPLGDDTVAEIFLSPYPPDWNTDLHLFPLTKDYFKPVADVDVDLEYDMVYMDHGIDTQSGTKIADGRYLMPLSFLVYGDWQVDVRMESAMTGEKDLQFVVKFLP